jgi:hypothetical protein
MGSHFHKECFLLCVSVYAAGKKKVILLKDFSTSCYRWREGCCCCVHDLPKMESLCLTEMRTKKGEMKPRHKC